MSKTDKTAAMLRVTTESGSVYDIDFGNGRWRKNNDGWDVLRRCFSFRQESHVFDFLVSEPMPAEYDELVQEPVVGLRMYVSSREQWWISTPVVSAQWKS